MSRRLNISYVAAFKGNTMSKITIATVAMPAVYDKQQNLRTMLNELNHAAAEGADLIVFPEQSLQGYLTDTLNYDLENVAYQFDQAEIIPQGECIAVLINEVIKLQVHAVIGLTERDADRPEVLYNCVVPLGPEGGSAAIAKSISLAMKNISTILAMISRCSPLKLAASVC